MTIELTSEQKLEIAQMTAQLIVAQLQVVEQAHREILVATRDFFQANPDLRGKHKELGEAITVLEKANPSLTTEQKFALAAQEVRRADRSIRDVQSHNHCGHVEVGTVQGA